MLRNNVFAGVSVRAGGGMTVIRHSVVAGTRGGSTTGKEIPETGGVTLGHTPNVTLENNVLAGNTGTQLLLWEPADGTTPPGGVGRHVYRHNVLCATDADQLLWTLPDGPKVKGMPAEYFRGWDRRKLFLESGGGGGVRDGGPSRATLGRRTDAGTMAGIFVRASKSIASSQRAGEGSRRAFALAGPAFCRPGGRRFPVEERKSGHSVGPGFRRRVGRAVIEVGIRKITPRDALTGRRDNRRPAVCGAGRTAFCNHRRSTARRFGRGLPVPMDGPL